MSASTLPTSTLASRPPRAAAGQTLVVSEGVRLDFETYGDPAGRAILLLHGLGADREMWWPQLEGWPRKGLFLIAPDLRGHGRSTGSSAFSIAAAAADLPALLDALGLDRVAVVGVSMGGLVAQQLALDFPERVERLVLVDTFSGTSGPLWSVNRWVSEAALYLPQGMLAASLGTAYPEPAHAPAREYLAERFVAMDMETIRTQRREVNRFDVRARLGEIRAPTLVVVGDLFGDAARTLAQETARGIPNARLEVLAGGGDPSNLLTPERFDAVVLPFLLAPEG